MLVDLGLAQGKPAPTCGRSIRIWYKPPPCQIDATHPLLPIASVVAGVFLLIAPRAVAVYLIFVGLLGLNGIYHIVK